MDTEPVIYAHRGIWNTRAEQNSQKAIEDARISGFGVETDFRSWKQSLVISHDPLRDSIPLNAAKIDFTGIPIALNIKEDGLVSNFESFIQQFPNKYTFLFDGSIPEMVKINDRGLPHALRLSEFENELPWSTQFLWLDGFNSDWWINNPKIFALLEKHFLVFVSPELHGREIDAAWEFFYNLRSKEIAKFGICTDYPAKLKAAFDE